MITCLSNEAKEEYPVYCRLIPCTEFNWMPHLIFDKETNVKRGKARAHRIDNKQHVNLTVNNNPIITAEL
jgi:hypothetical protein